MTLSIEQQTHLQEIGQRHNLRFIILHGSYVKGTPRPGSDLDVAVLGKRRIPFDELLDIHGELGAVFGDNRERELDLKSLHGTDPLFRYYVLRDSVLLYGERTAFNEFKAYAARAFEDARKLFRLEGILVRKQNRLILGDRAYA